MLNLVFAKPCEQPRAPLDPELPDVHVWRDADSRIVAWGRSERGEHWMHWPGLASFCFTAAGDDITAYPVPGANPDHVADTCRRSVRPMALQALGLEALHASAVLGPPGVVAFCATSQTGKSTLAFGLARRGYPQWADDAVVVDVASGRAQVTPLPFVVRLRAQSASFYRSEPQIGRMDGARAGEGPGEDCIGADCEATIRSRLRRLRLRGLSANSPTRARPEKHVSRDTGLRRERGGPVRCHPHAARVAIPNRGLLSGTAHGALVIPARAPAPLAAICVLERRRFFTGPKPCAAPGADPVDQRHDGAGTERAENGSATVEIARLEASQSFVALLTHAYCFDPADPDRKASMLRHYLDIAAHVPIFQMTVTDDLARLPAALDVVERFMEALETGSNVERGMSNVDGSESNVERGMSDADGPESNVECGMWNVDSPASDVRSQSGEREVGRRLCAS